MTGSWLLGVFVFAILIGDIKDIVANAVKNRQLFQKQIDAVTAYMNKHRLDAEVQERVKQWLNYTWTTQKSFDETQGSIRSNCGSRMWTAGSDGRRDAKAHAKIGQKAPSPDGNPKLLASFSVGRGGR